MGLLLLLFPVAEIYLFFKFVDAYSFWDALFSLFLSGLLGMAVMRLQGPSTLLAFQAEVAQGRLPGRAVLHRAVVFLGGLLLFVPGFLSDLFGVLCVLPGSRHLIVRYLEFQFKKGILRGRVFVGGFGRQAGSGGNFGGFGGFGGPFAKGPGPTQSGRGTDWNEPQERDAQVVDIEPLEITHTPKKDD